MLLYLPETQRRQVRPVCQSQQIKVSREKAAPDLPNREKSGLKDAVETLDGIDEIQFIYFDQKDVIRHPLVGKIVQAYDKKP